MRSITAGLRAAAQSLRARPYVRVEIKDLRPRWEVLHTLTSATDTRTDLCSDNNDSLYHVRIDGAGNVQFCIISNPDTLAQWNSWSTIQAGAVVYGDVAIEYYGGKLRVAYVAGGPYAIKAIESTDLGLNWSAPVTAITPLTASPSVALAGICCFYWGGGFVTCKESTYGTGVWSAAYTWAGTDSHTLVYGIGAAMHGGYARILYGADGVMYSGSFYPPTNAFSDHHSIQPGGDQTATTKADPTVPSLVAPGPCIATWVEDHQGTPLAWKYPIQRLAYDTNALHWGSEVPMCLDSVTDNRLALAHDLNAYRLFAANEKVVLHAKRFSFYDDATYLGPLEVSSYRLNVSRLSPGTLELEFLDPSGIYRGMGDSGSDSEAIKPLSEVELRRGYFTTSDEYEKLDPYYIIEARRSEHLEGDRFHIKAVDGFGLMALWHPPETFTYENRTVIWLLEEMAGKVGLKVEDDTNAAFDRSIATFSIHPSQTATYAFRFLLRLAGAIARVDEDGTIQCYYLDTYAPANKPDIGDKSEILQADYGLRVAKVTSVRVVSELIASEKEDIPAAQLIGLRLHEVIEDFRITAQNVADSVRDRQLALASAHARWETVTIHVRPDVELYDTVTVYANTDAIPAASRERDVIAIKERFDIVRARFEQTLTLDNS